MRRVSIVIPCHNAERWIGEAIDSSLAQAYAPIEVIVIDDGSTDGSLKKIQSYGEQVKWRTVTHLGGNASRNHGFTLSTGDYVQFLDADDYLLPQKISRQVQYLEDTAADAVYGDWRHQHHHPDGTVTLDDIAIAGAHDDLLLALLSKWWVAPCALLFRRAAVERTGGWDESLVAAQDRDFLISAALSSAKIGYQPGCDSIYRRYGNVTISTSNRERWLDCHTAVLQKSWRKLQEAGKLSRKYREAMAQSYFMIARNYFDLDRKKYASAMQKVLELDPMFRPRESRIYNLVQRLFGYVTAEHLASFKRDHGEKWTHRG